MVKCGQIVVDTIYQERAESPPSQRIDLTGATHLQISNTSTDTVIMLQIGPSIFLYEYIIMTPFSPILLRAHPKYITIHGWHQ